MGIPVRRAQAGESRDQVEAVGIVYRVGQCLAFSGRINQAETVSEPLDAGSGDKDAALEGIGRFVAYFPGNRSQHVAA